MVFTIFGSSISLVTTITFCLVKIYISSNVSLSKLDRIQHQPTKRHYGFSVQIHLFNCSRIQHQRNKCTKRHYGIFVHHYISSE